MTHMNQGLGSYKSEVVMCEDAHSTQSDPEKTEFSVLLLYPEYLTKIYGSDTLSVWVIAKDIEEAVWKAQLMATDSQLLPVLDPTDFTPLFVADGYVENQLNSSAWFDEKRLAVLRKGAEK